MSSSSFTRVDKLLSSMGYGARKDIARLARAGGIVFDQAEILDASGLALPPAEQEMRLLKAKLHSDAVDHPTKPTPSIPA